MAEGGDASLQAGLLACWATRLSGHPAMAFGRWIFLGPSALREVEAGSREGIETLAEELLHVRQFARLGIVGFLRRYLRAYFELRRRGLAHEEAYLAIPLEVEAREGASRLASALLEVGEIGRSGGRIPPEGVVGEESPESDERRVT